ncbi:MAG: hypothetical protein LBE06_02760 [Azoarcus sp.]|jgi:hypothetical protein|nr:hypothetical protein [Azoarcus sp.]
MKISVFLARRVIRWHEWGLGITMALPLRGNKAFSYLVHEFARYPETFIRLPEKARMLKSVCLSFVSFMAMAVWCACAFAAETPQPKAERKTGKVHIAKEFSDRREMLAELLTLVYGLREHRDREINIDALIRRHLKQKDVPHIKAALFDNRFYLYKEEQGGFIAYFNDGEC